MKNTKYIFLLIIFGSVLLFLSYIPEIYEANLTNKLPQNRVMVWGEHNYPYDYNVYLSKIKQGAQGRWSVVDKYDNNSSQKGVYLQMFYLLAGKIGGFFKIGPALIYHLLRLKTSYFWMLTIIFLNVFFLEKPRYFIAGILLSFFASSWPKFSFDGGNFWIGSYMSWWQELDVARRLSYIPHYNLNYIILGILIMLLVKPRQNFKLICAILFISFFIHPAAGLTFLFSFIFYQFVLIIWNKKFHQRNILQAVIQSITLFIVALIPLLYIKSVTSTYPWKSLVDFDQTHPLPFHLTEYLLTLGPVLFTGLAGAFLAIKNKRSDLLALVAWLFGTFAGLIIFSFFPIQSPVRFVQTANHIPLAILSVYFISYFYKPRGLKATLIFFIIALGLVHDFYSLKGQTQFILARARAEQPLVPKEPQIMYPIKDFWDAIVWLGRNTKRDSVVLSLATAGNYIPAYAGNFVYLGHSSETPHFDQRMTEAKRFLSFTMPPDEARKFLKDNNINYIFLGPAEKEEFGGKTPLYDFLTPVYNSNFVTIYKTN